LVTGSNPVRPTKQNGKQLVSNFLKSRREGLSPNSIKFYESYLGLANDVIGLDTSGQDITQFLRSLQCSNGGKHAYYRALRVLYNWLYSRKSSYNLNSQDNPILCVDAPKRPQLILPSLNTEQVKKLIDACPNVRDKAIIALFTESGLRKTELTNIKVTDIDWQNRIVRVLGKGGKEAYAPFGVLTEKYIKEWLAQYTPKDNVWGLNHWGITTMLRRLEKVSGLHCNPHTFRRTFACLLRKAGIDTMTIKDLGRWESLEMVQRYTRSVTFQDSLKFYKAPLSQFDY